MVFKSTNWYIGAQYISNVLVVFSAAAVSANEWSRGDSASTSVTSDKEHGSRGYPSLRAEINALDFSDDVTSVTSDRIGENPALYWLHIACNIVVILER